MFGSIQPSLIFIDLISPKERFTHSGTNVELNHSVRISFSVCLTFCWYTYGEVRPGMACRCQTIIEQIVSHISEVGDSCGIAGVTVIINHAPEHTRGALAKIAVTPI